MISIVFQAKVGVYLRVKWAFQLTLSALVSSLKG
jgi:hypothetical protein